MSVVIYALASVILVSLISMIGIISFLFKKELLEKILFFFISFSAGALLGDVFIHIFPEITRKYGFGLLVSLYVLLGVFIFFILEKFIKWRHCHIPTSKQHVHSLGYMNLIGDGLHNLIDGLFIGASYLVSLPVGIATTVAVILHEIPQEMGDFGVLIFAGFSRTKALLFNFLSAAIAILGTVIALSIGNVFPNFDLILMPVTAGGFIYIAGSDLIPEMHKETKISKSFVQLIGIGFGVGLMFLILIVG